MDCHNRNNTTSTATNTNDDDDTTTCRSLAVDSAYSWSMNTHTFLNPLAAIVIMIEPCQTTFSRRKTCIRRFWTALNIHLGMDGTSCGMDYGCMLDPFTLSHVSRKELRHHGPASMIGGTRQHHHHRHSWSVVSCRSLSIVIVGLDAHVYATWKSSATSNCISVEPPPSSPKASGRRSFLEDVP